MEEVKTPAQFAKEVWQTLSAVNVNDKTEKKAGFTYLSWAFAWGELMKIYPESEYRVHEDRYLENGTCEVRTSVKIKDGHNEITREMWLPVINHENKAIKNPDSCAINKNRMRCLVKNIGMFGLGFYIYAGEDLPETPKPLDLTKVENALNKANDIARLEHLFEAAIKRAAKDEQSLIKAIYEQRKAILMAEQNTENTEQEM